MTRTNLRLYCLSFFDFQLLIKTLWYLQTFLTNNKSCRWSLGDQVELVWCWAGVKLDLCEVELVWSWAGVKLNLCEVGKVWCEVGMMWSWIVVKLGWCEVGLLWSWAGVKLGWCEVGLLWSWAGVKLDWCEVGLVWSLDLHSKHLIINTQFVWCEAFN